MLSWSTSISLTVSDIRGVYKCTLKPEVFKSYWTPQLGWHLVPRPLCVLMAFLPVRKPCEGVCVAYWVTGLVISSIWPWMVSGLSEGPMDDLTLRARLYVKILMRYSWLIEFERKFKATLKQVSWCSVLHGCSHSENPAQVKDRVKTYLRYHTPSVNLIQVIFLLVCICFLILNNLFSLFKVRYSVVYLILFARLFIQRPISVGMMTFQKS